MAREPSTHGTKVYESMPDGWLERKGAQTAPPGYMWIYNHKSVFDPEYKQALLKVSQNGKTL